MNSSNYRRIAFTAFIILVVMGSCVLLIRIQAVQDLVRDGLILPLYYLVWLAGLLLRSIDEVVLWSVALIGLAMALIYGIAAARPFQNPFDEPRWRSPICCRQLMGGSSSGKTGSIHYAVRGLIQSTPFTNFAG